MMYIISLNTFSYSAILFFVDIVDATVLVQELIRRWDSERELFYDDTVGLHVQASAYTHWTDFVISTINIYARPNLCT